MSAALAEPIVQSPETTTLVPFPVPSERSDDAGLRPLLPVVIAGAIATAGSLAFVAWILMWLALRSSGINAPW